MADPGTVPASSSQTTPLPHAAAPSRQAKSAVTAIVRESRSSFQTGMRLLGPAPRLAMYAVYAFCREIDDIADGTGAIADKLTALEAWKREIDAVYTGRFTHPIGEVLAWAVGRYDLPKGEFEAIIRGMRWDIERPAVAPDMESLGLYARYVAGAVGILSVRIFGVQHAEVDRFAIILGEALQFTNILRDIDEDGAVGRLYVPDPLLRRHGVTGSDPALMITAPGFDKACHDLAKIARERFEESRDLVCAIGSPRLRPALVMMAVYGNLLRSLTRRGWVPPRRPITISAWRKAGLAIRAAAVGWRWPSLI